MSDDLIRREDAIRALRCEYPTMPMFKSMREEWAIKTEGFRKAEEVIMSIPSADRPQGEWIPCSERLPKPYVEVLVCDDFGWINLGAYRPCDVSEDCSGWSIHAHTKIGTEEVIAWMPLPKPWEGADYE